MEKRNLKKYLGWSRKAIMRWGVSNESLEKSWRSFFQELLPWKENMPILIIKSTEKMICEFALLI
jgi:hypothetical protein